MSALLKQSLKNIVDLTETEYDHIISHFEERIIPKRSHLFVAGEICKMVVYCEKGCFRKYYVNDKGDDIVLDFAVEDYWVGDLNSLINRVPTSYNFQALETCTVHVMSFSQWEKLSIEFPRLGAARYKKEKRSHDKTVEQLTLEKYASAEEKYQKMLERFPGIVNRVAAIHIASYLGIKPQSLSRLKRKFAKQIS